jgi:beta-phosphoglucomutase family hydrolase
MKKAVIFDMDGVISDTINHHIESESEVFANHGIHITPQQIIQEFNAMPDDLFFRTVFERAGKKADIPTLYREKLSIFKDMANKNLSAVPGVIDFIKTLRKEHVLIGVASSSPTAIIEIVLSSLAIKNLCDAITSTDEVEHGKPHPDIFLLTAKKLGVLPDNCIVIEDASRGIDAAIAAGMKCIAITTTHDRRELKKADKIIDSFTELSSDIIRSL